MKELVKRMKKDPKPKKKVKPGLAQKDRFIEYVREIEADKSGERFKEALNKVAPRKKQYGKTLEND